MFSLLVYLFNFSLLEQLLYSIINLAVPKDFDNKFP